MINANVIEGRLTRDPETTYTNSGTAVLTFTIANNRYMGKDREDRVGFFDVKVFGKYAEAIGKRLYKGQLVAVAGELCQDRWEKNGQKQSRIYIKGNEIELLERRNNDQKPTDYSENNYQDEEFIDDVPFG